MNSTAKGKVGTWLVLAEWVYEDFEYKVKEVKTTKIDGTKIKEDTLYKLESGKFIEVEDER